MGHSAMKGGVSDTDTNTCYVTITLLKAKENGIIEEGSKEEAKLNDALTAVRKIVSTYKTSDGKLQDPAHLYPYSICAHALIMDNPSTATEYFNTLNFNAKTKVDQKWWDDKDELDESLSKDDDMFL